MVVDWVVDDVVDGIVAVVFVGFGPGGQGQVSKSGVAGPLTQPSQCAVVPHSVRR